MSHPAYLEVIKEGIRVANKNLPVLLTQFIAGIALVFVFFFFLFILAFVAIGSLPAAFNVNSLSTDTITNLVQASFMLVALAAFFFLSFLVITAFVTAYVHAGNLGCIIETARGSEPHFTSAKFFSRARKFMVSMLGLYIIWGLFAMAGFIVLFAVAGIGFEFILVPLKEAGRALLAFALGVPFIIALILSVLLYMFFLYAGWALSGIILVGDDRHAFTSLKGAYEFIKTHFWDSLLFALLMFVLIFFANIISNSFFGLVNTGVSNSPAILAISLLPLMFIAIILQMYIGLIARSSFVVYYVTRTAAPASPESHAEDTPSTGDFIIEGPEDSAAGPTDPADPANDDEQAPPAQADRKP